MKAYFHFDNSNFKKNTEDFFTKYYRTLVKFVEWACFLLEREAKSKLKPWNPPFEGGVDTGRLRASIITEIKKEQLSIEGKVGPTVEYAKYVEFGTRPHFIPFNHPEIGFAIRRWCERHGLPVDNMWGLNISGTPHPFMTPAWNENREKIFQRLLEIARV